MKFSSATIALSLVLGASAAMAFVTPNSVLPQVQRESGALQMVATNEVVSQTETAKPRRTREVRSFLSWRLRVRLSLYFFTCLVP
jgi:hypothetical protein